jgi:hypothetical protein
MLSISDILNYIFNFFSSNINKLVNELKKINPKDIPNQLKNTFEKLSVNDFVRVVHDLYNKLSKEDYIQKIIDTYKKFPINDFKNEINNFYRNLPNEIIANAKKFKLLTFTSDRQPTDKNIKYYLSVAPTPSMLDLRDKLKPVRNQGEDGCCVAFALAGMKEYQEMKQNFYSDYLSPWYIYLQRSNYPESGMNPKNALEILKERGISTEKVMPYMKAKSANDITPTILNEAKKFVIVDFAFISEVDELKQALNQKGPCIIAMPCYNSTKTFWKKSNESEKLLGGHCVLVVGFRDDKGFILRNSWGEQWGENGYTWFPYSDWGIQHEVWSAIDFVNPIQEKIILVEKIDEKIMVHNKASTNSNYLIIVVIAILIIILIFFIYRFKNKS